jgi:hypothetical protein
MMCHSRLLLINIFGLLVFPQLTSAQIVRPEKEYAGEDRIEDWTDKTVLVVTPHPDDETFSCGGTLAQLAANGNNIQVLIYTTDNLGSNDPNMTKARLKNIRRAEEEEACEILGIPKTNITWCDSP